MSQTVSASARTRRSQGFTAVGVLVIAAAFLGSLWYVSAFASAPPFSGASSPGGQRAARQSVALAAPSVGEVLRGDLGRAPLEFDGAVGEADGALPHGVTVFDDRYPGIANLDPDLLRALRDAAADAADDGIEFSVNSGWRSADYQAQLLREAVFEYRSEEEAARWVGTADTSAHVSGGAIDLGPAHATAWLFDHGAQYGLCRIYGNEPWHFELRPEAIDRGCPPPYPDPTHDPRMQR
jgi:zinc D-Ala-D-Ala carboxypeptidase